MPIHNLQIKREGFWGKGNKVYYSSDEEKDGESQSLKALSFPLLRENVLLSKGGLSSEAQCDCMTRSMFTMVIGLDSLGVWHHFFESVLLAGLLLWRSEREKE
jgi:hypothetical protein